jgi:L-lysine 2,3-aminomutase
MTAVLAPPAKLAPAFASGWTEAVAALMDPSDPADPIARQYVPDPAEPNESPDESPDPIGDKAHSPIEGVVHRHADRVLLKPVHVCPVYCRFCFRKAMVGPDGERTLSPQALDAALGYIAAHPVIAEVIVTGGDPFMLSAARARALAERLAAIPHVQVVRWHTRMPVADPERVTAEYAAALTAGRRADLDGALNPPPPLWGRGRGGGSSRDLELSPMSASASAMFEPISTTPTPNPPPHKGEGEADALASQTAPQGGGEAPALHRKHAHAVWVAVHVNHPRELSDPARAALARLIDAGIPLVSQSVLLKGVNDDIETLVELFRTLTVLRVKPYYLHHLDRAPGTGHFRVPLDEGRALAEALRARLSGLALPTYVLDIPGGAGKALAAASGVEPDGAVWRAQGADGAWRAYRE